MKITFVSNFINHHQIPFCGVLFEKLSEDFSFVQIMPMDEERRKMGWSTVGAELPYLNKFYEDENKCADLIRNCDVLLLGWTGAERGSSADRVIEERLSSGKPVIRISERIYREGRYKAISPRGLAAKYREHIRFRRKPVYMLCAGSYVSGDFSLIGAYPGKMFRWGYFPPLKKYTDSEIHNMLYRDGERLEICFAARLIKLKHPEFAVYAAEFLKNKGKSFHVNIVGDGPLRNELENMIKDRGLDEYISLVGSVGPEKVRKIMEQSHVFLFNSNYLEGWGAVVNEAMNSACAVIASYEAGAVPFLVTEKENGLTYDKGRKEEFLARLDELSGNPALIRKLQKSAYETISNEWNAEVAGARLLEFCDCITGGIEYNMPQTGPMSRAEVLPAPGFFRTLQEDNHLQ